MPVGLSPNAVQSNKSESTGISANYTDLSTFGWAANAAGSAAYLTNDSQPISVSARLRRA